MNKKFFLIGLCALLPILCHSRPTDYCRPCSKKKEAYSAVRQFSVAFLGYYAMQSITNLIDVACPYFQKNFPLLRSILSLVTTLQAWSYVNELHQHYSETPYHLENFLGFVCATLLPKPASCVSAVAQGIRNGCPCNHYHY